MCLGIPMRVVEIESPLEAWVETQGVRRKVSTMLVAHEEVKAGDWLVIHVGSAIGKIDEAAARESLRILQEAGRSDE